jgi:hypothetical protein
MNQGNYRFCLLSILLLVGCSRSETVNVSGTVTWESTPIANGDIVFASIDPHIPAAAGKIENGAFHFACKPGEKRVEIRSYRLTDKKTPQGKPIGMMYIPERFNSESELKANVTLDGKNDFEFALKP